MKLLWGRVGKKRRKKKVEREGKRESGREKKKVKVVEREGVGESDEE